LFENGGKQYKAVEGGHLEVDRLQVELGTSLKLERVLLLADGETVTIGTPLITDSPVWTTVVEHFRGPKVTIFNYSPKKRIRVKDRAPPELHPPARPADRRSGTACGGKSPSR